MVTGGSGGTLDVGEYSPVAGTPLAAELFHLSPYFPPDIGGLERVALELAAAVSEAQPVTVLTTFPRHHGPAPSLPASLQVRRFRSLRLAGIPLSPGLWWSLLRLPRSSVIHAHLAQAGVVEPAWIGARLRGYKLVIHFHMDVAPSSRVGPIFVLYKRTLMARALRAADRVIVLSEEQVAFLADRYGVESARVHVVPNGVSAAVRQAGSDLPGEPYRGDRPLRLLFVGRLSPQKNLGLLLDALTLIERPFEMRVVGDGPQRQDLEERAARSGLVIDFAGPQDETGVIESFRWADILLLTSEREGMPLALLEAMTMGLPIVATSTPGISDLVGEAGRLTEPTPQALATAIDQLAADPVAMEAMARAGIDRAASLDWRSRAASVLEMYRDVIRD